MHQYLTDTEFAVTNLLRLAIDEASLLLQPLDQWLHYKRLGGFELHHLLSRPREPFLWHEIGLNADSPSLACQVNKLIGIDYVEKYT